MNKDEKKFIRLTPFKMQVIQSFPFIDADFDALTNYELLCKVVDYLNVTVENVNLLNDNFEDLKNAFNSLKNYIDNYFDNLDVQEEINNKLDEMAESGELTDIIAQYLGLAGLLTFNTVADMKAAENLTNGSTAKTSGFHTYNDNGGAFYKIRTITNSDIIDEMTIISLTNSETLIAELIIENPIIPEKLGAYGDGTHDDSDAIQKCFSLDRDVLLIGYYKCSESLTISNGAELTISGINFNKSALKFINEAYLTIGSNSNVNELRLNNFSIVGDRSQDVLFKISYITNVMLNQINIAESSGYLLELDHADIVFMDKCTFAGSNQDNVWQPCKGIKMTSATPVYINNCNIWNLSQFIDIKALTRNVCLTNNWIEFVNIIINAENVQLLNTNLILHHNSITFSPHGSVSFLGSRLINLNTITDGFDVLVSVKENNIIYYTTNPTQALVEIQGLTGQTNVHIKDNVLFTRLQQMSAYALKVDAVNTTKLYYESTTNADGAYGCQTDGVLYQLSYPNENYIKKLNLSATDNETGNVNQLSNGHIWYNNGGLYIRDNSATKRVPFGDREEITNIADTSTATSSDVAAKLNALMNILRRTNIIR